MAFSWGYGEKNGPHLWADHWEIAKTPKYGQSPINIETEKAKLKTDWAAPEFKYKPERSKVLNNTGASFQVDVEAADTDDKEDWSFRGGPVKHAYSLAQFHFHWGKDDSEGSEHTVNGKPFAAECHLVHYNRDLYKSAGEAFDKAGGLLVLGIFLKPGQAHAGLQQLLDRFSIIEYKGESEDLAQGFDPSILLPEEKDRLQFWHYYGSLTTPPLYESVNWIVFHEPLEVSPEQLAAFRRLNSHTKDGRPAPDDEFCGKILQNFRPALDKDFTTKDKATGQSKRIARQLFTTAS